MDETETIWFYSRRGQHERGPCEGYRAFDAEEKILFTAYADRLGKPVPVFMDDRQVVEIANRKNYLVNGRTDIQCLETATLIGSYSRLGRVHDSNDRKIGRWNDARKWTEEFKENLVDAIGNALLGCGDVPGGANTGDTHVLSNDKEVLATLQREQMPFFPDPPKSVEPHKLAKLASRIIPGKLGESLGEVTPPYGWKLTPFQPLEQPGLLNYSALVHLEFLRFSRSA